MDITTDLITADARSVLDHAADIANAEPYDAGVDSDSPHTEPERHAIEYLDEHNIELCGATDSRLFFTLPDGYTRTDQPLMVKIARYSDDSEQAGTTHNQREREQWADATDAQRDLLLPVIDAHKDDAWLLTFEPTGMERGEVPDTIADDVREQGWDIEALQPTDVGSLPDADTSLLINYGSVTKS